VFGGFRHALGEHRRGKSSWHFTTSRIFFIVEHISQSCSQNAGKQNPNPKKPVRSQKTEEGRSNKKKGKEKKKKEKKERKKKREKKRH
jgi:hypothetical protein